MQVNVVRVSKSLLLTDPVSLDTGSFSAALDLVIMRRDAVKVVVVRGCIPFQSKYFILDGNHRAVVAAMEMEPIMLYEICTAGDVDVILRLEQLGEIPPFPHRGFLMGSVSLSDLKVQAMQAATRSKPLVNAFDRAKGLATEQASAALAGKQRLKEGYCGHGRIYLPNEIHTGFGSALPSTVSDCASNMRQEITKVISHPKESNNSEGIELREKDDFSRAIKPAFPFQAKGGIDYRLWTQKVMAFFSDQISGQEFPCQYAKFAKICGEPTARGQVIATALVRSGVLERVRVGTIQGDHHYPSGRPEMIRITYWRFILPE